MSASTTRWVSRQRTGSARTDAVRPGPRDESAIERAGSPVGSGATPSPAAAGLPDAAVLPAEAAGDASTWAEAALSTIQASGSRFIAAYPGVSTARGDLGFRSLNGVDRFADPQAGKIVSRWLGPFTLESGTVLPDLVVAYRHDGIPVGEGRQILVVHALTGSADAAGDWWAPLIGQGQVLDTDKYGVICINLLGSRYGTSGPTSRNSLTGKP